MTFPAWVRTGAPRLLLVLVGLLPLLAGPTSAAVAQEPDTTPSALLSVSAMTGVLGPGSVPPPPEVAEGLPPAPPAPQDLQLRLLVTNDGDTPLTDLRVLTEVFSPVDSRSRLRQSLDGGIIDRRLREVVDVEVRDGDEVEPGEIAGVEVTVPGADIGWIGSGGVYPVQISVFRGSEQLDRVVTAAVYLADAPVGELNTLVVWPLDAAPWRGVDGIYPAGVDEAIEPGGRLDRILEAAERAGADIALAPAAHLLEDLTDRADGFRESVRTDDGLEIREVGEDDPAAQRAATFLTRIRDLLASLPHPPVAGAYADADVAGLASGPGPLPVMAGAVVAEGRSRVQTLTGHAPDRSTYLATAPLDAAALGLLPAEHVIVPWSFIEGPDLSTDPDLPPALRSLSTDTRRFTAAVADPRVSDLLDAPPLEHGTVVAVQRFVAETAMVFFEAPGRTGRPLVVMPPIDWDPHPRLPAPLLTALADSPWLQLTGPSEQLDAAEGPFAAARLADLPGDALPGGIREELVVSIESLDALRAAMLAEVTEIEGRRPEELADQLMRAPSEWFRGSEVARAATLVRDVQSVVDAGFGEVEVPSSVGIILTSETGTIPVTLQRQSGVPLRVQVEVESQGRLTWTGEGRFREVQLPTGSKTVSFSTLALSRGRFPVTVTVTDPSGARVLERVTLSVSSTAISRPALYITGGVVVALLMWGAVRRRRPERPKLEVVG